MAKKILFLIHTLGGGGAEKVLVDLVNNLNKRNYEVTVMTVVDIGVYKESLLPEIEYKTMLRPPFFITRKNKSGSLLSGMSQRKKLFVKGYILFWKYVPAKLVHKLFIREKYDYEIAFLEGICAKIIGSSPDPCAKKYAWIHVDLINQHKSGNVFKNLEAEKKTYDKFDEIICVSEYVKKQFINLFGCDESGTTVKYNPIDEKAIYKMSLKQTHCGISKRKFTFCSIGRLNKQKSYMRLLKAVNNLYHENYDFDVWIIGEGTDRENLTAFIEENHLNDKVFLLGYQKNPFGILRQADFFVCSSVAEGYSTAVSEAVVLGIPVITTECSGMKEILGDSEYGLIVENSVEGMEYGLKKILTDESLRQYYKRQVQVRQADFRLNERVNAIEQLFGSV